MVETMKLISELTALDILSGLSDALTALVTLSGLPDALKLLLNTPACCSLWRWLTDLPNTSYILKSQNARGHTRIKIIPHDSCFPRGWLPSVLQRREMCYQLKLCGGEKQNNTKKRKCATVQKRERGISSAYTSRSLLNMSECDAVVCCVQLILLLIK